MHFYVIKIEKCRRRRREGEVKLKFESDTLEDGKLNSIKEEKDKNKEKKEEKKEEEEEEEERKKNVDQSFAIGNEHICWDLELSGPVKVDKEDKVKKCRKEKRGKRKF